ncbi:hypothetical protein CPA58_29810, partial [Klebsiella pneumoniae]
ISKGAIDIPALSDPQQRYGFWNLYAITLYIRRCLISKGAIDIPALSDPQQRYGFWNLYAITLYIRRC